MPQAVFPELKADIAIAAHRQRRKAVLAFVIAATSASVAFVPPEGLEPAARIALAIFVFAAGLWITELIPPFATSIVVIVLCVFLLGRPIAGRGELRDGFGRYQDFLNPLANPVLVLFFASFLLAIGASKHGLDVLLARTFLKPFGSRHSGVLLGVILTTGVLSMFMSSTATATMMIGILTPILHQYEGEPRMRSALLLAVPFAASIGSMGTIVGAPPNAVAASILAERGAAISFEQWMVIAVPFVAIMLLLLWGCVCRHAGPPGGLLAVDLPACGGPTAHMWIVVATFFATLVMWLSEPIHRIPSSVVALGPIAVLTATGVITRDDLQKVPWDVLILVAGGLTLSIAVERTGLAQVLVDTIPFESLPPMLTMLLISLIALILCNLMSNTATTALLVPMSLSIEGIQARPMALAIAFVASLALSLPISQPPNALAFATGQVTSRLILLYGTALSLIGLAIALLDLWAIRRFFPEF